MRHAGVWLRGDLLRAFWTRLGDAPERILPSTVERRGDWRSWRESDAIEVRRPTRPWERASQPVDPSARSSVSHAVSPLHGPFGFVEGAASHLVYAFAGESGLAIARLEISE